MARLLNDASSERMTNASPVLSAYPFTMCCWFNSDDATVNQNLMSISDTGGDQNYWGLSAVGTVAGDPVRAFCKAGAAAQANADTSSGYSANTWHHACGVFASATSRTAYIDGGSNTTNTTSLTPTGLDVTTLGTIRIASFPSGTGFVSGRMAEAAFWDAALTAAEVASLAKGVSPLLIRPGNLVAYWPLLGKYSPEIDVVGRFDLTLVGTAAGAHPRVLLPKRRSVLSVAGGAPPATTPARVIGGGVNKRMIAAA